MKHQNIQSNNLRRVLHLFKGVTLQLGNYITILKIVVSQCSPQ
jgi:hypothetical protein